MLLTPYPTLIQHAPHTLLYPHPACFSYRPLPLFGDMQGWEYGGQTPWCYVHDNCSLASASGSTGSFGHRYVDCRFEQAGWRRLSSKPELELAPFSPSRQLSANAAMPVSSVSPVGASGHGPEAVGRPAGVGRDAESALLEDVTHLKQPYVALVSAATEGFVTVEM